MNSNYKIAFVSRLLYPDPAANALQTMRMAAALSHHSDTQLFVHDLSESENQIRARYAVDASPLRISSLHATRWPAAVYRNAWARCVTYNSSVAGILGLRPEWWGTDGRRNVLFVRSRLELLYWGLVRPYFKWLRNWIFVYEAHEFHPDGSSADGAASASRRERARRALHNFDLVTSISSVLGADIEEFTGGAVKPQVLSLVSGLPRLADPPKPFCRNSKDPVLIGYIGTVDRARGVDSVLKALRYLPNRFRLRIVGRIAGADSGQNPSWLSELLSDPAVGEQVEFHAQAPYSRVAEEIDSCDIVIQPAGHELPYCRYATPLKLFDYMARGKPIVAAGVPNHLELLRDGFNARIYRQGDPEHLAACISDLAANPRQADEIALAAWEGSAQNTYDFRASRMLEMIDHAWENVHAAR